MGANNNLNDNSNPKLTVPYFQILPNLKTAVDHQKDISGYDEETQERV